MARVWNKELGGFDGDTVNKNGKMRTPFDKESYILFTVAPGVYWAFGFCCNLSRASDPSYKYLGKQYWRNKMNSCRHSPNLSQWIISMFIRTSIEETINTNTLIIIE